MLEALREEACILTYDIGSLGDDTSAVPSFSQIPVVCVQKLQETCATVNSCPESMQEMLKSRILNVWEYGMDQKPGNSCGTVLIACLRQDNSYIMTCIWNSVGCLYRA